MGIYNGEAVGNDSINTSGTIGASGVSATADVTNYANTGVALSGTYAGLNVTFEVSLDGTNWFAVNVLPTNSATATSTSGVIASPLGYAFLVPTKGFRQLRVRSTAWTSGTATVTFGGAYT